jgi:SnoaL-like domain
MWRFFTEDFQLEDPGAGVIRTGLDAAQRMMEAVRALAHDGQLEILDMFESGHRVAVRWSYKGCGRQLRDHVDIPVQRIAYPAGLGNFDAPHGPTDAGRMQSICSSSGAELSDAWLSAWSRARTNRLTSAIEQGAEVLGTAAPASVT